MGLFSKKKQSSGDSADVPSHQQQHQQHSQPLAPLNVQHLPSDQQQNYAQLQDQGWGNENGRNGGGYDEARNAPPAANGAPAPPTPTPPPPAGGGGGGAKKLFGFGGKKESPASTTASTPVETPAQQGPQQGNYEQARGQWAAAAGPPGGGVRVGMGPPRVQNIAGVVGWTCAHDIDYTYILAFADHISLSVAASKDAAKALRKELKYGAPEAQTKALRLLGILMRNTDLRFKQQVVSKKFLGDVQDLVTSKKTDAAVKAMALRVLSPLAYEYQRDAELSPLTALWNKIKPVEAPINGEPLDPSDDLFTPTGNLVANGGRSRRPRDSQRIPTHIESMNSLMKEAERGSGNARLLSDATAFTPVEELEGNEIVAEFYHACLTSQQILSSNLDWASVQASQSRANIPRSPSPNDPNHQRQSSIELASNNPFAPRNLRESTERVTREEEIFEKMLSANSEIVEALKNHDTLLTSHLASKVEQTQLLEAEERSRNDTRFDRTTAGEPDARGDYLIPEGWGGAGEGTSGSREPSPSRFGGVEQRQNGGGSGKGKGKSREEHADEAAQVDRNPFHAVLSFLQPQHGNPQPQPQGQEQGGYGGYGYPVPESPSTYEREEEEWDQFGEMSVESRRQATVDSQWAPIQPSEKALGKLRRVSVREDADVNRQEQLEAELKEKYRRQYEENEETRRRSVDSPPGGSGGEDVYGGYAALVDDDDVQYDGNGKGKGRGQHAYV
ncbi:hypothetical protein MNV49_005665 [Pseudohyphozyma bogoriensis]|nr:hypothetical protein MNV49_005665 [Pseudohyphozyma bogoriensis]